MSVGHIHNKPAVMGSAEFTSAMMSISKAALIDALWCAAQLGTDETPEQITANAARNAMLALEARGDRVPAEMARLAAVRIDSDPIPL